jgi:predicted  nucleic acid-binding Zn-ribbon protein
MGRNKDLRKKIAGRRRMIERHEEKIRAELSKPLPDESLIAHWRSEIEAVEQKITELTRRLERNW